MERRPLLANLARGAAAMLVLGATRLFGQKSKVNLDKTQTGAGPCKLPVGGPRAGYFPNVVLINQDFVKGRFYRDLVMGKTVMFTSFSTTNPSEMQKKVFANLLDFQKVLEDRLGRDVFLYSFTFDPEHDTPQVLHEFAKGLGIGPGWSLLTGQPEDMDLVLSRVGLGYMKRGPQVKGPHVMPPHFGLLRLGNEALDRWTTMPAVFGPHMILNHLSVLEVRPERKDPTQFVRGGPFPKHIAEFRRGIVAEKANWA
jgi:protein SCO1/2